MSDIIINDIHAAYGRTAVLFGISLEVREGELVCVMGRNGVGKTTLLNAITGLMGLTGGSISFDGKDISKASASARARMGIGYVPQGHAVFPQLTTRENLQVVNERLGKPDKEALNEVIDLFPALASLMNRPAGLLSGGQAKQLAIARALITRPKILILDEPTEGIQPSIIHQIEDTINDLHKATGMTMLLVEQYVEFALRLADRYAVMDGGRIVDTGDTATAEMDRFASLIAI
ncbi:MAG: urea ABC transporter ATP-binding subunit UrtE [Acidimicrobiia bacterium]|nr:urea ABC transporter ATP-binding subunit UrtE [Acidimicrobiia bacterium]